MNKKVRIKDWFQSLKNKATQAKIDVRIERIKNGNLGYCKSVGDGIMELKIDYGPGFRIYFGQFGKKLVILLNGGDKSSQPKDIKIAQKYWSDYRRRYGSKKD